MNEPFNIESEMLTKVKETEDAFIFQTLSDFAQTHYQLVIEKDELIKAIQLIWMMRENGTDISKPWTTATQQSIALRNAYDRGFEDGLNKKREELIQYLEKGEKK
jgi:hypothetical protein